jgi:hypothetical protein
VHQHLGLEPELQARRGTHQRGHGHARLHVGPAVVVGRDLHDLAVEHSPDQVGVRDGEGGRIGGHPPMVGQSRLSVARPGRCCNRLHHSLRRLTSGHRTVAFTVALPGLYAAPPDAPTPCPGALAQALIDGFLARTKEYAIIGLDRDGCGRGLARSR